MNIKKFLKDYAFYIVIGLLICLRLANVFVINVVSGESMLPNYKNGELLVGTGIKGELQRGDIVVAKPGTGNKLVIKRIIGLPGEHIVLENGYIYANGEKIEESYLEEGRNKNSGTIKYEFTLGENEYLICGDNRDNSYDGRAYGPLSSDAIVQRILFRIT